MSYRFRVNLPREDLQKMDELKEMCPYYDGYSDFGILALRDFISKYQPMAKTFSESEDPKESFHSFGEALKRKYLEFDVHGNRFVNVNDVMFATIELISRSLDMAKTSLICVAIRSFVNAEYERIHSLSDTLDEVSTIFPSETKVLELGPEWA